MLPHWLHQSDKLLDNGPTDQTQDGFINYFVSVIGLLLHLREQFPSHLTKTADKIWRLKQQKDEEDIYGSCIMLFHALPVLCNLDLSDPVSCQTPDQLTHPFPWEQSVSVLQLRIGIEIMTKNNDKNIFRNCSLIYKILLLLLTLFLLF